MAGSMSLDGASWSWIEKFQKATKLNDSLTGIIIGLLIILPFNAIEVQNGYYSIHSEDEIVLSVIRLITCIAGYIAVIYLIRGVLYIIHILKNMPNYMNIAADGSSVGSNKSYLTIDSFGHEVRKRFLDKRKYYYIISLILVPFIALDIWVYLFVRPDIDITNYNDFISFINSNRYLIIFDVYNKSIAYFMEYLIAYMIWTIMNISKTIDILDGWKYRSLIRIDIFSIDGYGGLGEAINSTKRIAICYFISLSLTILTFSIPLLILFYELGTPYEGKAKLLMEVSYLLQIFLYVILLILGVYYIGSTYIRINNIFNKYLLDESFINNKICNEKRNKLRSMLSEHSEAINSEVIDKLRTDLEIIFEDRENLIKSTKRGYNLSAILAIAGSFLSSLVIPILTMVQLIQNILDKGR